MNMDSVALEIYSLMLMMLKNILKLWVIILLSFGMGAKKTHI